jgi:hypothetical protein
MHYPATAPQAYPQVMKLRNQRHGGHTLQPQTDIDRAVELSNQLPMQNTQFCVDDFGRVARQSHAQIDSVSVIA